METEAIGRSEETADERKGADRPVDLKHLSRYTLGERALEREILELFCTQSAIYLERLRVARPSGSGRTPPIRSKVRRKRSGPGAPRQPPNAPNPCPAPP
jgi:hypothetical protein